MKFLSKQKKLDKQNFFDAFKRDINFERMKFEALGLKRKKTNYKPKTFQPFFKTKLLINIRKPQIIKLFKLKGYNPRSFWPWYYKTLELQSKYTNVELIDLFMKYGLKNIFLNRVPYLKWLSKEKLKNKLNFFCRGLLILLDQKKYSLGTFVEAMMHSKPYKIKDYYYLEQLFILFRDIEKLDLSSDIKSKFLKKIKKKKIKIKFKKEDYKGKVVREKKHKVINFFKSIQNLNLIKVFYKMLSCVFLLNKLNFFSILWIEKIATVFIINNKFIYLINTLITNYTVAPTFLPLFNIYREEIKWFEYLKRKEFFPLNYISTLLATISANWIVYAYKSSTKISKFFLNFRKLKVKLQLYNFGKSEEEFEDFPLVVRKRLALFWVTKKTDAVSVAKRIRRRKIFKALNYNKSIDFFELKFNFYYNIKKSLVFSIHDFLMGSVLKKKKKWFKDLRKNNLSLDFFFKTYIGFLKTIQDEDIKYFKNIDLYCHREKLLLVHYYNPYRVLNIDSEICENKILTKYLINT
jgi:hypothetical protein